MPTPSAMTFAATELVTAPPTEAATVFGSKVRTSNASATWLIITRSVPVKTSVLPGIHPAAAWVADQRLTIVRASCSACARLFMVILSSSRPRELAAVDADHHPADVLRGGRGEEGHHRGNLARPAVAVEGAFLHQPLPGHLVDREEARGDRPAGRNAVDGDVVGPRRGGREGGVGVARRLGDGVDGPGLAPVGARRAADVDDATVAALDHLPGHRAAAEDAGEQVAVEHGADIGDRHGEAVVAR